VTDLRFFCVMMRVFMGGVVTVLKIYCCVRFYSLLRSFFSCDGSILHSHCFIDCYGIFTICSSDLVISRHGHWRC